MSSLREEFEDYFTQPFEPAQSFITLEDGELGTVARVPYNEFISAYLSLALNKLPERLELTKDETDTDYFYGLGNNQALNEVRSILEGK